MLILGGYGFLYKNNQRSQTKALAEVLYNKLGNGNTLVSLDCISFTEMYERKKESELYRYTADSIFIDEPSVLKIDDGIIFPLDVDSTMVDASIFFPRTKCQSRRKKQTTQLKKLFQVSNADSITFVQVFYYKEFKKSKSQAIPLLQFKTSNTCPSFPIEKLKKGKHVVIQHSKTNKRVKKIRIR